MRKRGILAVVIIVLAAAVLAAVGTCGGRHTSIWSGGFHTAGSTTTGSGGFQSADSALAELDALACPDGVDSALWAELKEALEEALRSLPEPRLSSRDAGTKEPRFENRDSSSCMAHSASTPPTGGANRVDDLGISDNGDGTYTLSWHYRNLGDYGQDGTVGIEDLTPMAVHFGEIVPEDDLNRNSLPAVIDGSGNGVVDIADVTPIAQCFQREVHHYLIEGAEAQSGPWEPAGEVAQDTGTGEGRLLYEHILSGAVSLWHRVVPYDAEGTAGEP